VLQVFKRHCRLGTALAVCTALATAGGALAASTNHASMRSNGLFSASITKGPDAGLALWGSLSGTISRSGEIRGTLRGDTAPVRVTGSASAHRVTLVFHLPNGRALIGVGQSRQTIRDFGSLPSKGRFTGPGRGDSGRWDQVVCTALNARPGVPGTTYRCVTSEGHVYYYTQT
jgi:hypothetical protein